MKPTSSLYYSSSIKLVGSHNANVLRFKDRLVCKCGQLLMMVNERPTSFFYSDAIGFWIQGPERSQYVIRHCPWCGIKLPTRIKNGLVAPQDEHARIFDKATTVKTLEDCIDTFGDPDYNKPFPDDMGLPTDTQNIEYYRISDWYTLEFYITGPECRFVIHAKLKPLQEDAEPSHAHGGPLVP